MNALLEVRNLHKEYPLHGGILGGRRTVHAVNGISFAVHSGNNLGLAGESGCGKTTTARLVLKLLQPTEGVIRFAGRDIAGLQGDELLAFRRQAQLVFQNPYEALNPRFTVLRALLEPLIIHGIDATAAHRVGRVTDALHRVHLNPPELFFLKYPHQLSGGQLQRVVIARALLTDPVLLVADEPVSMLDVSIRAGVLNLMRELGRERSLATIYISHDLALLRYMCDRTAVMYLGTICEIGPTAELIEHPRHPYTQALVSAVPDPDPEAPRRAVRVADSVPTPFHLPPGCPFADRCPEVMDICRRVRPPLHRVGTVQVACHLYPDDADQPHQDAAPAPEAR